MKPLLIAPLAAMLASAALAQTIQPSPSAAEAGAPRPARARGIPTALAVEADQAAIAACAASGLKVTAMVVDSAGVPIAMISGDGAAEITQRIASGKAIMALRQKAPTGEVAQRANADKALMDQLVADPRQGPPRQGGMPILIGTEAVGAIAVSGSPTGAQDEPCAKAGIAAIQSRLK